jgi:hypothetical protein
MNDSKKFNYPEGWKNLPAGSGDRVKVRRSPETESAGFADRNGIVHGITTVSVSGVEVVGTPREDTALNVFFEEENDNAWFAPELIEFIDHDPGSTITLEGVSKMWTRDAFGMWIESSRILPFREWLSWVRGVFRGMLRH